MSKTPLNPQDLPYRPCVGIMLINKEGLVWVGERLDTPGAWQMPQGGIDKGEDPTSAAFRELEEEIGATPKQVTLITQTNNPVFYDLPDHLVGKIWKGKYRGQTQQWFLLRYNGLDEDINIKTKHSEFGRWKWTPLDTIVDLIVPFKRDVYEQIVIEFKNLI